MFNASSTYAPSLIIKCGLILVFEGEFKLSWVRESISKVYFRICPLTHNNKTNKLFITWNYFWDSKVKKGKIIRKKIGWNNSTGSWDKLWRVKRIPTKKRMLYYLRKNNYFKYINRKIIKWIRSTVDTTDISITVEPTYLCLNNLMDWI